jgi:hypothetical protein
MGKIMELDGKGLINPSGEIYTGNPSYMPTKKPDWKRVFPTLFAFKIFI